MRVRLRLRFGSEVCLSNVYNLYLYLLHSSLLCKESDKIAAWLVIWNEKGLSHLGLRSVQNLTNAQRVIKGSSQVLGGTDVSPKR